MLHEILAFCTKHSIPVSRFGRDACNDPRLVSDLRLGAQPRPAKIAKIRAYMANYVSK